MNKRHSAIEVIAMHFGWSYEEVKQTRYHYGHTDKPIYVVNEFMICAGRKGTKPEKSMGWDWEEVESDYGKSVGWSVWIAKDNTEVEATEKILQEYVFVYDLKKTETLFGQSHEYVEERRDHVKAESLETAAEKFQTLMGKIQYTIKNIFLLES